MGPASGRRRRVAGDRLSCGCPAGRARRCPARRRRTRCPLLRRDRLALGHDLPAQPCPADLVGRRAHPQAPLGPGHGVAAPPPAGAVVRRVGEAVGGVGVVDAVVAVQVRLVGGRQFVARVVVRRVAQLDLVERDAQLVAGVVGAAQRDEGDPGAEQAAAHRDPFRAVGGVVVVHGIDVAELLPVTTDDGGAVQLSRIVHVHGHAAGIGRRGRTRNNATDAFSTFARSGEELTTRGDSPARFRGRDTRSRNPRSGTP